MAKKRTQKCRYPSRYSPSGYVHAAQYITELICEKKAKVNKSELPIKFWELSEWKKYYRYQIMLANKLLKEYSEHAIISALNDKRLYKTYSLRSPFLVKVIKEYEDKQRIASDMTKNIEYNFIDRTPKHNTANKKTNSIINKLKELE